MAKATKSTAAPIQPGERVAKTMANGSYESQDAGALKITKGERELIAAYRALPGTARDRLNACLSIVEFIGAYGEGARSAGTV